MFIIFLNIKVRLKILHVFDLVPLQVGKVNIFI